MIVSASRSVLPCDGYSEWCSMRTRGSYYLVISENRSGPEIDAFQSWVLEQFPLSQPAVEHVESTVDAPNGESIG